MVSRRKFLRTMTGIGITGIAGYPILSRSMTGKSLPTGLVYDDIYLQHTLAPGHPESPERLVYLMQSVQHAGLQEHLRHLHPELSTVQNIELVHTSEHIAQIKKNYSESWPAAIAVVGGILVATDAVCNGEVKNAFCATRPPGHHALNTGREEGFCFFNGIAIAACYARKYHGLKKILIVDWDYHHGNGTEAVFYDDPDVLFFSTHDLYAYPGTGDPSKTGEGPGEGFNINVHLDCGAGDEDIISAFEQQLLPRAYEFEPEFILISAGFDSRKDDLLGCFNITDKGFARLTREVMDIADHCCGGKIVSVLEGGYNLRGNASAATSHIRTMMKHSQI